jgi:plastocyanin
MARRLALVAVFAFFLAAPASADDATVSVANFQFSPGTATINQGEKVTWNWDGADKNHTVTSDAGQAESFESHPGVATGAVTDGPPGETFSHTFTHAGTFTYNCRVHGFTGTVKVVGAGGPPPTDTTPADVTLKILSKSLSRVADKGKLKTKVTVDEAATVKLYLKFGRKTIGKKTLEFADADTKTFNLRVTRKGRNKLEDRDSARVKLIAKSKDEAGNKATDKKSKTLGSSSGGHSQPPPGSYAR